MRLKELALARVRFGYLRLTVLLRREGWSAGKKLVYRLYREMDLSMRTKKRRRLASRSRILLPVAEVPSERWSMDFVTSRLENGRYFRVLTLVDQYTRECLALEARLFHDRRQGGGLLGRRCHRSGLAQVHPRG